MSLPILKKYIGLNQIDGSRLQLNNDDALKALNTSGNAVDLLKLNNQNKVEFLQLPISEIAPTQANELTRKEYVDTKVSEAVANVSEWSKYVISYSQLAAAALENSIVLLSLPAKGVIHEVVIKSVNAFSYEGSSGSYNISVGVSGNLGKYASAFDGSVAPSDTNFKHVYSGGLENFGSAANILVSASAPANLDLYTQGQVEIYVLISQLP